MRTSNEVVHYGARNVKRLNLVPPGSTPQQAMDAIEAAFPDLPLLGIGISMPMLQRMASGMDAIEPTVTTGSIPTPIQFLQNWLPGFVNIITAARKIDELVGITGSGSWEDEEVVQGVMELTGTSVPYGDLTNIPFSSWNANYERRTVVRFEEGMQVGRLEEARSARAKIDSSGSKREAAALALEIQRNRVGFYGFNNGLGRTYGFLNDPALPAYSNLPTGGWATATYLQITGDIRSMFAALRSQSQDVIDPKNVDTTLALATDVVDFLSVTSEFGNSVQEWLTATYPRCRVVSAPELNDANGGANVGYLYAENVQDQSSDDGRVFIQIVPTKFQVLGVEQTAKGYIEDYSNATAGIMAKRPYAIVRRSNF
jgi:hypothetical protein